MRTIILLLLLIFSVNAFATDPIIQSIVEEGHGKQFHYHVIYQGNSIRTNSNLIYYWHSAGKLKYTEGDYSGDLLHGIYEEFNLSGSLLSKGEFHYGRKNNQWKYWNNEGNLKLLEEWRKGYLIKKTELNDTVVIVKKYRKNKLQNTQYRNIPKVLPDKKEAKPNNTNFLRRLVSTNKTEKQEKLPAKPNTK